LSLGSLAILLSETTSPGWRLLPAAANVPLGWGTLHTVMTFHYAHLFYSKNADAETEARDSGGLEFPKTDEPSILDFVYYSFVIGMTSQRTRDRLVERLRVEGIRNERVLEVIRATPRHLFVDEALASRAYEDTALPIGYGQTISQPYIVARMTELLLGAAPRTVLEVGTGSGYQAAILSKLAKQVYAVEIIPELATNARYTLEALGISNVEIICADGRKGWPAGAPYDAIVVAAAAEEVPSALIDQLKEGGRLVIPVGGRWGQSLQTSRKHGDRLETEELCRCVFVPLVYGG